MHTILIPYRDRPEHLSLCLKALSSAPIPAEVLKYEKESIYLPGKSELILLDQGSTTDTEAIIAPFIEPLNIKYHQINDNGPFHKTKLLNEGLVQATNDIITVLDVDCLVKPEFFQHIQMFWQFHFPAPEYDVRYDLKSYEEALAYIENSTKPYREARDKWKNRKLAHRFITLDPEASELCKNHLDIFHSYVACNPTKWNHAPEDAFGSLTGFSVFTTHIETLQKVGGWDERFIGYGFEDVELNQRLHRAGVETTINTASPVFHLWHKQNQSGWNNAEMEKKNRVLFESLKAEDFPPLKSK